MSPRNFAESGPDSIDQTVRRVWIEMGLAIRQARVGRHWSVRRLAAKAKVSPEVLYRIERGQPTSLEAVARAAGALGVRPEIDLVDPRRRGDARRDLSADAVHSAMGELEARHLHTFGIPTGVDEPYQHFHFAGRADVVAWNVAARALLHIENRTRFPDFQDMAGAFNAKKAYLAQQLGARVGIGRWRSQTHVIAALWTSEVLHSIRMRRDSFRSLCPDATDAFAGWWRGEPPVAGTSAILIVFDPLAQGRQRQWIGLDDALTARPRHAGYAQVAVGLLHEIGRPGAA
jgi:transcriptional regulator with XRE-family HTH domain